MSIVSKAVDITIPAAAEYTIVKQGTAETGYSSTYYLTKDNVQVGEKINIPKDMVVESGSVKTCTTPDVPVEGYKVGDKYIDLVLANAQSSHIYILVTDLVDVYEAGNGITITGSTIAIDDQIVVTHSDLTSALAGYQTILDSAQMAAVNSGITATDKGNYDDHIADEDIHVTTAQKTAWTNKADRATTLSGYGITDGLTYVELA